MTTVEIKKGKGIEDLASGYAREPEEERCITHTHRDDLTGIVEVYANLLKPRPIASTRNIARIEEVLTPEQIERFLIHTAGYEDHEEYSEFTGRFVTQLIHNSYSAGHNDFTIDTRPLKGIDWLGERLKGSENEKIRITIDGNLGEGIGHEATGVIFYINGNTGNECGDNSVGSEFHISGSAGEYCGVDSDSSTFSVGDIENECGLLAKYSRFLLKGKVEGRVGTTREPCTFMTPNKETLDKLLREAVDGDRIVFINEGKEEVIRDYE